MQITARKRPQQTAEATAAPTSGGPPLVIQSLPYYEYGEALPQKVRVFLTHCSPHWLRWVDVAMGDVAMFRAIPRVPRLWDSDRERLCCNSNRIHGRNAR